MLGYIKPYTLFYVIWLIQFIHYLWLVVKNKYIILPFLLLAWTIIFAHSIVPHHHHSDDKLIKNSHNQNYKHGHGHNHNHNHNENPHKHEHEHEHEISELEIAGFHDCDHDCHDHACHFHVEVLTQVTIDNVFVNNSENSFFNYLPDLLTERCSYYLEFISSQKIEINYLRGPPSIA